MGCIDKIPWNKGLTKHTNKSIFEYANKVQNTMIDAQSVWREI